MLAVSDGEHSKHSGASVNTLLDHPLRLVCRLAIGCAFLALMALVPLGGCSTSDREALRWAGRWLTALNSHQPDSVLALLDPDAMLEDPAWPRPFGGAAISTFWTNLWALFPDLTFKAKTAFGAESHIVIEWQATGHRSGKSLSLEGVHVLDVRGVKITHVRAYYDWSRLLPVVGGQH